MKAKSACRYLIATTDVTSFAVLGVTKNFSFTETLKYLPPLLEPPNTINLKTIVLNTEAHPLRRIG
jgi:hypothetical protein